MSLNRVLDIAGSALTAQSKRLNVVASNIANVDSAVASNGEPYKARRIVFTPIPVSPAEPKVAKVAVDRLEKAGGKMLGVILNKISQSRDSGYKDYEYYRRL